MIDKKATAKWIAHLAMQPGWWQYARHKASELERLHPFEFSGIKTDVANLLREAKFEPSQEDREWKPNQR